MNQHEKRNFLTTVDSLLFSVNYNLVILGTVSSIPKVIVYFKTSDKSGLFHHDSCLKRKSQDEGFKSMNGERHFRSSFERYFHEMHHKTRYNKIPAKHPR